ncbi:MAG TPA: STAS domain-containing protein [bacterium]|jgi:anti-sigma B factor antagonist|nr:STAS domain-containing protein [bacterium]
MELARVAASLEDGLVIARLSGEIDLTNAAEIADRLFRAVPHTAQGVVIDLSDLRYIDSRGVYVLLQVLERLGIRQQEARLVLPDESPLFRLFTILSIDKSPGLHRTVQQAAERIRTQS